MGARILMNNDFFRKQGYEIDTTRERLQVKEIFRFLTEESYWSEGLTLPKLEKALKNSLCFGVYYQNQQIGFARVITDEVALAYLCDVYILAEHRNKGLSKWLLQNILATKSLATVRRFLLATKDAQGLYAQFGFRALEHPDQMMSIYQSYTETQP